MSYKIEITGNFKSEAKKLIKKYPSLEKEIQELGLKLSKNPLFGTPLGNDVYKIRVSIFSKGKGKRGGARVITFVMVIKETVYLLAIYNKGDKDTITETEIKELLKSVINS